MRDRRTFDVPLTELRFDAGTRRLSGRAMPYGETTRIGGPPGVDPFGFEERFVYGAFARSISERVVPGKVKFFGMHGRSAGHMPIGSVVAAREEPSGLFIDVEFAPTQAAADAIALVRSETMNGLSVGFGPVQERVASDGVREVTEAVLIEVSLVDVPAYENARVTGVRSRLAELDELAGIQSTAESRSVLLALRELDLWESDLR